ncbi:MAG: hypothetical protein BWX62_00951 [Bacteroidetes bacterium ADurb.Bin037]|nr:MAG: hypothetical protein BWX62_00951 [Bacteroidetes bacterium ADurb.Bin037]
MLFSGTLAHSNSEHTMFRELPVSSNCNSLLSFSIVIFSFVIIVPPIRRQYYDIISKKLQALKRYPLERYDRYPFQRYGWCPLSDIVKSKSIDSKSFYNYLTFNIFKELL